MTPPRAGAEAAALAGLVPAAGGAGPLAASVAGSALAGHACC
ncbi:MAG TPA: hypothetical protein VNS61_01365 [Caldimonas sp.]|nr:hypothetical protein [Caldimonas sp.]